MRFRVENCVKASGYSRLTFYCLFLHYSIIIYRQSSVDWSCDACLNNEQYVYKMYNIKKYVLPVTSNPEYEAVVSSNPVGGKYLNDMNICTLIMDGIFI